jgi:hypothetical protein
MVSSNTMRSDKEQRTEAIQLTCGLAACYCFQKCRKKEMALNRLCSIRNIHHGAENCKPNPTDKEDKDEDRCEALTPTEPVKAVTATLDRRAAVEQ